MVERFVTDAVASHGLDVATLTEEDVDRLDQAAWDLQDAAGSDDASYLAAFGRARAASAAVALASGALDDAVYEAIHAMPSDYNAEGALRRLVEDD